MTWNDNHPPPKRKPSLDARVGTLLGKYRIIGVLGKGGMGVVYEAQDPLLKRRVAIKLLPDSLAEDEDALQRFLSEARAAGKIHHPNTVGVFAVHELNGSYHIVMELVEGGSAQDFLKTKGAFNWPEATRVIADACRGLAAAHKVGLIHRDIKPANIMRAVDGTVKLADFGLAKGTGKSRKDLTAAGAIVGTPQYMSPEQCTADPLDFRSDIYSLGITYHALLTGAPPFDADAPLAILHAHCNRPLPDPRVKSPLIPQGCVDILRRATAKHPDDRYASAGEMLAALDRLLAPKGDSSADGELKALTRVAGAVPATARPARRTAVPMWIPIAAALAVVAGSFLACRALRPPPAGLRAPVEPIAKTPDLPADPDPFHPPTPDPVIVEPDPIVPVPDPKPTPGPRDPEPPQGPPPVRVLEAHRGSVRAIVFDPSTATWISAGDDGRVAVWDAAGDKPVETIENAHPGGVNGLGLAKNSLLATGGNDGAMRTWERRGLKPRGEFPRTNPGAVRCVVGAGGLVVSVGAGDGSFRWTLPEWTHREQPNIGRPLTDPGECCAVSDDNDRFAVGTENGSLVIGDIGQGQIALDKPHAGPVRSVAFTSGHTHLFSAGCDGQVLMWETGNPARVMKWGPDDLRVSVVRTRGDEVTALACSPWNDLLAYAESDGTIRLHKLPDLSVAARFSHGSSVRCLAFAPDGRSLVSGAYDGKLKFWDVSAAAQGVRLEPKRTWMGHTGSVRSVAVSPDGRTLASGGVDGTARLWNLEGGPARHVLAGAEAGAGVAGVAFAPDGSFVQSVGDDGTVKRWNPSDGALRLTVNCKSRGRCRPQFSTDLNLMASSGVGPVGDPDRFRAQLWELPSGREILEPPALVTSPNSLALSGDGRFLCVGSAADELRIIDVGSGQEIARIAEGSDKFAQAAFPTGDTLALTVRDRVLRLRSFRESRELRKFHVSTPVRFDGECSGVAFSPDGRWFAGAAGGSCAELRDLATGALRAVLIGGTGEVTAIAFSSDGRSVVAGSSDQGVRLWDVSAVIGR